MTMRILLIAALLALQAPAQSDWSLSGAAASAYTMTANGRATDAGGAAVTLTAPVAPAGGVVQGFATVSARMPAETLRGRRVTVRGELRTRGAGSASLWMRVDRDGGSLFLDNGQDRAIKGDAEWTPFAVSLPLPASASTVIFGVMLQGGGTVSARALTIEPGPALAPDAPVAPAARAVLDAAIGHVRKSAWMRDNVNWAVVEPELRLLAGGAEQSADVYPAIRYLLSALGDRHSFLMPPAATTAFRTGGAQNPPAEVRVLTDGIGYINVPAYGGGERTATQAYATKLHESIAANAGGASCGWIVDLRGNGGGNMWPMLAGLKPFLGDEPLGTFVSRDSTSPPWKAGQAVGVEPPAALMSLEDAWVAVLYGPRTASSGEAVAIAFRGRPRAHSFGQPTAGLSSANQMFPLPDGSMIALTTAIEADRTGKLYGEKVDPEEVVGQPAAQPATPAAPPPSASPDDPTVAAAVTWLRRSCRAG
jgi:C-terminal processing protease CtpA/Prc